LVLRLVEPDAPIRQQSDPLEAHDQRCNERAERGAWEIPAGTFDVQAPS
jgi:hypothetical protein